MSEVDLRKNILQNRCSKKFHNIHRSSRLQETTTQMFFCWYCKNFKHVFLDHLCWLLLACMHDICPLFSSFSVLQEKIFDQRFFKIPQYNIHCIKHILHIREVWVNEVFFLNIYNIFILLWRVFPSFIFQTEQVW